MTLPAEGSSLPDAKDEPAVFRESDFVLLIDAKDKGWVVKIADIALLEACGKYTRFHFTKGTALYFTFSYELREQAGRCRFLSSHA